MTPLSGSAKAVTRRRLREERERREPADGVRVADRLAAQAEALLDLAGAPGGSGRGLLVAAYASLPGEPGTVALRARLHALGQQVLLPVLLPDRDLDWVVDTPTPRDHARLHDEADPMRPPGARLGRDAVARCDLVLVPALAVDRTGTRLGQGGGSYDRVLTRLGRTAGGAGSTPADRATAGTPLVLAVVHADELLPGDTLPREPHDVAVDGVLTEDGVRLLTSG